MRLVFAVPINNLELRSDCSRCEKLQVYRYLQCSLSECASPPRSYFSAEMYGYSTVIFVSVALVLDPPIPPLLTEHVYIDIQGELMQANW